MGTTFVHHARAVAGVTSFEASSDAWSARARKSSTYALPPFAASRHAAPNAVPSACLDSLGMVTEAFRPPPPPAGRN